MRNLEDYKVLHRVAAECVVLVPSACSSIVLELLVVSGWIARLFAPWFAGAPLVGCPLSDILSGGVCNGFLLGQRRMEIVPFCFCGGRYCKGHFFWDCSCYSLVQLWESRVFANLMVVDKISIS